MSGCYGNSAYDVWLERQADEYWGDNEEEDDGDPDTAPGGHDDY